MRTPVKFTLLLLLLSYVAPAQKFLNEGGVIYNSRWGEVYSGSVTSIELNGGKPYNVVKKLTIEAEITWLAADVRGGIITLHNSHEVFLRLNYLNLTESDSAIIRVDFEKDGKEYFINFSKSEFKRYKWHRFKITLDPVTRSMSLDIAGKNIQCRYFKDFEGKLSVTLGMPFHGSDERIELAYVAVRNVSLYADDISEYYPFYEVEGTTARDTKSGNYAKVKNGVWLNRLRYEPRLTETFMTQSYNADNGDMLYNDRVCFFDDTLFVFEDRILRLLSLSDMRTSVEKVMTRLHPSSNIFMYKNSFASIYCGTDGQIAVFDRGGRVWGETDTTGEYEHRHYGASLFYNPMADEVWAYGGYGYYTFKDYLRKYNFSDRSWSILPLKAHSNSYRAAPEGMNYVSDDAVLFFGGEGSTDGKVTNSTPYFHNYVLRLGLKDTSFQKAADFPFPDKQWEPLMLCPYYNEGEFIILAASRGANVEKLKRKRLAIFYYSIKTGRMQMLSSEKDLPYAGSFTGLYREYYAERLRKGYFSREKDELYLLTGIMDSTGQSKLMLSVMKTPLMTKDEFEALKELSGYDPNNIISWIYYILSGGLGTVITGYVFFNYYARKKKKRGTGTSSPSEVIEQNLRSVTLPLKTDRTKNYITLFGEFRVLNRKGENAALQMTQKNKQVFIYILLNSIPEGKGARGVLSEQLGSIFWPDLPAVNVKNNRNVTIKRIREAIAETDGLQLAFQNQHFYFEFGGNFKTDLHLLNEITNKDEFENFLSDEFALYLSILENGRFLEGISFEWLDFHQDRINNKILLNLNGYFEEVNKTKEIPLKMRIASVILRFDELNETAFRFIIKLHISQKNLQSAHSTYDKFIRKYREETGRDYHRSFEDFINEERENQL